MQRDLDQDLCRQALARQVVEEFRLTDWKYEGTRDGWHISDHVGATGQWQLYELWQSLSKIEGRSAASRCLTEGAASSRAERLSRSYGVTRTAQSSPPTGQKDSCRVSVCAQQMGAIVQI